SSAFLLAIILCLLLLIFSTFDRVFGDKACSIDLCNAINPNNAPAASLVRLPGLGTVKVASIIEYRNKFTQDNPSQRAFSCSDDLQKIKGIGPKTVEKVGKYLRFE
ncbi:MAG: helix-hairpin-helix domain-containing protein, partial [Sedimentisphaerales bacterium]|nr:helix-hairpin-helix domain-containing protein [Sedimentisphaerales bacterium]